MKRLLPAGFLLLACVATAAPPTSSHPQSPAGDAALQRQMAELQTRMNALAKRMATLSAKLGDDANATALAYLADRKRAMLGIAVRHEKDGTTVVAVTPDSPAERAGVKVGDVITDISARSMTFHGTAPADLAWLRAGEPVELTVLRDGKTLHLKATPERFQTADWQATARAAERAARAAAAEAQSHELRAEIQARIDQAREAAMRAAEHAGDRWQVFGSPWWGLNLAPLNPDLGGYFGTNQGALVLSRDADRYPQIRPGDVITAVDGKPVARPGDVVRAVRADRGDPSVQLTVRRHGKPVKLAIKTPSTWLPPLPPPPPPAPPAPPTPAAPVPPPPPASGTPQR